MKPLLRHARTVAALNPWTRRAAWVLVLLALCVLASFGLAYYALWQHYDGALDQVGSRSQRLDGVLRSGDDITARLGAARRAVQPWLHPAGESAPNQVAQRLRELVVASGSTLVSSQAIPGTAEAGKLVRVRLDATVTGEWSQVMQLLATLQRQEPPFWIRSANLMREGPVGPDAPQQVRLSVQLEAPLAPSATEPKSPAS